MTETQHLLEKIRPPRVQITYDVEIGDAIIMKQLPFVVGIMADLAGVPANPLPKLKDRKFVDIDSGSLNEIMSKIAPRLPLRVPNVLTNAGGEINVLLNFPDMDAFNPVNVARQVPPLAKLLDARQHLSDLLIKLDGNDTLDAFLQEIIQSTAIQKSLQSEVQAEDAQAAAQDAKPGDTTPGPAQSK